MNFLAESTNLGDLEILEIYVQYNGPRLLACKNQAHKIFLALWVDEEEESDLWLYMLVSLDRLKSIRTGEVSLHQAFATPENNYVHEVIYEYTTSKWNTKQVSVNDIDQDCLPLEGTFLNCDAKSLPHVESQKLVQNAISKTREIVNLVLEPSSCRPHEFPALELGKILSTFQPLVNQLGTFIDKSSDLKHREIAKKSAFNVFATSPGSFQIELASSIFEVDDVFGNSFAGNAIENLFRLINLRNNVDSLQSFMSQFNKKTATKYRQFLEALISSGSGLKIEWASPTLTRGGIVESDLLSINEVLTIIKRIESLDVKEYEIMGELFKVDKNSWEFGLKELKTESLYKGEILEQAKSDAGTATISRLYTAKILESPKINSVTNETKSEYRLMSLTPYKSNHKQLDLINNI